MLGPKGTWRSPAKIWLLFIVTLSLYDIYWWFQVNQELRDYLGDDEIRPGLSVLAMYIPIANVVSLVRGGGRIRRAQEAAGIEPRCSGWLGLVLTPLFAMNLPYYQSQLNAVWAGVSHDAPTRGAHDEPSI
jgi:hypothetical protein